MFALKKTFLTLLLLGLWLLLTSCTQQVDQPTSFTITSPASGATVTASVPVQISAAEGSEVARVDVYARGRGSNEQGMLIGSANQSPYVIQWLSEQHPNNASLELVAVGIDGEGQELSSPPVAVTTQNSGAPRLELLTAYTVYPEPEVSALDLSSLTDKAPTTDVLPPLSQAASEQASIEHASDTFLDRTSTGLETQHSPTNLETQQTTPSYLLEWQWQVDSSTQGTCLFLSEGDLAGPYDSSTPERCVSNALSGGSQKADKTMQDAVPGVTYYGTVRGVLDAASGQQTGLSNADKATHLGPQTATSPIENETVSDGRPSLTWEANSGAVGYLYYLYDKNPWEEGATLLWSNYPQSGSELSASYPSERAPLASGEYYWWVAGVSFDDQGKADAFSFSPARRLVVP